MGGWAPSETTIVALFSVFFGGGVAAVINAAVQKALKRQDVASAGLGAVLGGFNNLLDQQQELINTLRKEMADLEAICERRVQEAQNEMKAQGEECDKRIRHLEDELQRLHEMYQRQLSEMGRRTREGQP